jgi:hypothetical protein
MQRAARSAVRDEPEVRDAAGLDDPQAAIGIEPAASSVSAAAVRRRLLRRGL